MDIAKSHPLPCRTYTDIRPEYQQQQPQACQYLRFYTLNTNLLERQREGIAIAKRCGRYTGGRPKDIPGFEAAYARYKARELTKSALARELRISRPTLDKRIREYESGGDRE